ncbi:T9SS type A sorting domain-containing protein [Chitinophaga agrisoli]|uniref:T9SS type A sorting domain-containing protein n=1 Tax=Chitinophaga agrisoli TaxID=2607653 RepID=A0A5B2VKD5_9BACT|nr:T9SS type A sorting domain-containing protein [Chitinophaga agrisoli]KAA2238709.1 T9SS type A sorting domain-containing protein [Chitinophaga agrisoli]
MRDNFTRRSLQVLLLICLGMTGSFTVRAQNRTTNLFINSQPGTDFNAPTNITVTSLQSYQLADGVLDPEDGQGRLWGGPVAFFGQFGMSCGSGGSGTISAGQLYPIRRTGADVPFFGPYATYSCMNARFAYDMLPPRDITVTAPATVCGNEQMQLYSENTDLHLFSNAVVTTALCWEYSLDNTGNWQEMDTSSASFLLYFKPADKIPEIRTAVHNARFRCRIRARYASAGKVYYSNYTAATGSYTIAPPAPTVDPDRVIVTKSCFGLSTASITVAGSDITGTGNMRWLVRPGNVTTPCDPDLENCGLIPDQSLGAVSISSGVQTRPILAAGTYTLWLLNPSGTVGNCMTAIPDIDVASFSQLQVTDNGAPQTKAVTCAGNADGSIGVTATGSNPANGYYFTLQNEAHNTVRQQAFGNGATMFWQGLPAGKYYAAVIDGGTCNATAISALIEVGSPKIIDGSVTSVRPTCNVPGNGSVTVTAVTPGLRYRYNLYRGATTLLQQSGITTNQSYTFNGLSGDNYSVEILDVDQPLCGGVRRPITVNTATALSLQLTARDSVTCFGGNDGRLQFTAAGGSGSYQFTLTKTGGTAVTSTTGNFTGLTAGSYSVKLTNQLPGCSDQITQTFDVYERRPLQVQLQTRDIDCNGASNGEVIALVSGGSTFYSYTWQQLVNGAWVTDPFWFSSYTKIDALKPGTYRVIINDNRSTGCTVTSDEVTITEPPALSITDVKVTEAICDEGAAIEITAAGGTPNYSFGWSVDGGNNYTIFTKDTRLYTPGTYTLQVKDAKGCTAEASNTYDISLPDGQLDFAIDRSVYNGGFNVSCMNARDGRITLTATGGNGGPYTGYHYQLDTGPLQTNGTFTGLAAGIYIFKVMDARGCVISRSVRLTQPSIMFNASKEDIKCYGQATGSILAPVSGGAEPYTLTINGQPMPLDQPMGNLPQGVYALHVTDANNCSKDTTITINYSYPQLSITNAVVKDIVCFGATGNITLSATGGDGVFNYWTSTDNWATQTAYTSGASLPAGNYALRVTDGQGCTTDHSNVLSITTPAAPVSFTATLSDYSGYNISCKGGDNGYAEITATGGNGAAYSGYTYAIDNGPFTAAARIERIKAGGHIIRVKDGRGCEVNATYNFTEATLALDITLVSKQDVSCALATNGSITVAGTGGAGGLQYSLDNTNWQTDPVFSGLGAGNYIIQVRDANSCGISLPVQVNALVPLISLDNVVSNDIVCFGEKGTINIQAHGGNGALTSEYSLNGGAFLPFDNTTPLAPGTYKVRVTDAVGCSSTESDPLTITAPAAALKATVTTSDFNGVQISCYGLADGVIDLAVTGGNGGAYTGYQYSINNSAYTPNSNYTGLTAGSYAIKVKDGRGCIITDNVELKQAAAPLALTVTKVDDLLCGANPTGKISVEASGGRVPYTYSINNGGWANQPQFEALSAGNYKLQVLDLNGCIAGNTAAIKALLPAIAVTTDITPVNCFGETNGALKVNVTGGDGNYNYQWTTPGITGPNPQRLRAGGYTVKVTDGTGCGDSYTYQVEQPDLLTLQTTAPAICDGVSDGAINAAVEGGTTPYQYMLNEGVWQGSGSFEHLDAGDYKVTVQDANGCTISKDLTIQKNNVKPYVNFLVATRKNATDTLVIKDISLPAPDNITWTYAPEATFLGMDGSTPLIKFSAAGTYWIRMEALFGGCTYTLQKEVSISPYDPIAGPGYSMPVHVIDTVTLSPNPNNGNFRFRIKLNRSQQVVVYVIDVNGARAAIKQYSPGVQIDDQFALGNVIPGAYILRVIAENESRDVRFIITR